MKMDTQETKLYKGDIVLRFDEGKHLYTVQVRGDDWKRAYGATRILGVINKPALMYWAIGLAVDHVGDKWEPGRAYDEIEIKEILKDAKYAHRKVASKAADTGTMIHKWVEEWIRSQKSNGKPPVMPVNAKLREATEKFLKWVEKNKVVFVLSEQKVYSEKYNYAGTLDFTAQIDGELEKLNIDGTREMVKAKGLYMGDTKTSSAIYVEMGMQLSAYQGARNEEFPDEKYEGRIIIRIGKDGAFEPVLLGAPHEKDLNSYIGAYNIFDWIQYQQDMVMQAKGR
jgi:hypothetical protein